jgi:hypothetical protein
LFSRGDNNRHIFKLEHASTRGMPMRFFARGSFYFVSNLPASVGLHFSMGDAGFE